MAKQSKPAVDSAVLSDLHAQTGSLAGELSLYVRRRITIIVDDGDGDTKSFDTGGNTTPIEIRMNARFVAGIRNADQVSRMWTGLALLHLGRVLFPAADQHAQAQKAGVGPIFRLLDDEQNERRGTALDQKWGQAARASVAFMVRSKNVQDELGGQAESEADNEPTYRERLRQFGFDLRRHLEGARDEQVIAALALVPSNLKDLPKEQLLDLARQIKEVLAVGIVFPVIEEKKEKKAAAPATTGSAACAQEENTLDSASFKQWWRSFFRTRRHYVLFGASAVLLASLLLAVFGFNFWSELFWLIAGVVVVVGVLVVVGALGVKSGLFGAIAGIFRSLCGSIAARRRPPVPGRSRFQQLLADLRDFIQALLLLVFVALPVLIWRKCGWLRRGWDVLAGTTPAGYGRVELWFAKRWYELRMYSRQLWALPGTRVVVISLPFAAIVAMSIAVWYVGLQRQPWYLLTIELAFVAGTGALLFWKRKQIVAILLDDVTADDVASWQLIQDSMLDKRTLTFDPITTVVPVRADHTVLSRLDSEVAGAAVMLRALLEEAGFELRDKEDVADGDDVGDNAHDVLLGDLSVMVDEEDVPKAQAHFAIALDCSRSNEQRSQTSPEGAKFARGRLFAHMLDRALKGLAGVSSRLYGYTDDVILDCGTAGEGRLSGLKPTGGGNNDAGALQFIAEESLDFDKPLNVLVLVSDGLVANCSWGSLNHLAATLRQSGFVVIPVAVDTIKHPAIEGDQVDLLDRALAAAAVQFASIVKARAALQ